MSQAARFFAKVYSFDGSTFRRVLDASLFTSVPSIIREVGKPAGDLTLALALPWDDYGYGESNGINEGDLVKVYAVNVANPTGLLVYQGHIEEIETLFSPSDNHVSLKLYPIDALLSMALWKEGGDYIVEYASADIDTIFDDAIDDINTAYGVSFFSKNLGNPSLSVDVQFVRSYFVDALITAAGFLDTTWYWRINANGQIDLDQWNEVTADHSFTVGKDVESIRAISSLVNVINREVVSWGAIPTDSEYQDVTSIGLYGLRMGLVEDSDILAINGANARGAGDLSRSKNPFIKTELVVNAQYAIETIKAGDTCTIRNVKAVSTQFLSGIFRIVRVEYDGATAKLHLSDIISNFGNEFSKAIR